MAVSRPVLRYYAERIHPEMGRERAPESFRPLSGAPDGLATVEGCRGGGKNILEVAVRVERSPRPGARLLDVRVSCGLCNVAMYVAADLVVRWARGRALDDVMALDPLHVTALTPFFDALGGPGRPDDAREKLQYAVLALQNAVRAALGRPTVPVPALEAPTDRDWDDLDP